MVLQDEDASHYRKSLEVVDVVVMIPTDEDREITLEEVHNLHQNAQTVALLVSSLGPDEFRKVNGMESAK